MTDYLAERRKRKEELEFSDFRGGMVTKMISQKYSTSPKILSVQQFGGQRFLTSVQLVPNETQVANPDFMAVLAPQWPEPDPDPTEDQAFLQQQVQHQKEYRAKL